MKLSVVIPCFNEKETIEKIVEKVISSQLNLEKEIIIIDDGSTDGTREILENSIEKLVSKVVYLHQNKGKGNAINKALKIATGDLLIIQDADLEYDPNDYNVLVTPLLNKQADVVYGSRLLNKSWYEQFFVFQYLGNRFLTMLSNFMTGLKLTDMETCYKVLPRDIYTKLNIEEAAFGIEPEITAKLAKLGARICEREITYSSRKYKQGKKITWKDGISAIRCVFKYS
jgi:glycosyltransferase involved in cell wall biosynthesis